MAYKFKEGTRVKVINADGKNTHLIGTVTTIYRVYSNPNDKEPYQLQETGDTWWPETYFGKVQVTPGPTAVELGPNIYMYHIAEGKVIDNGKALLFIPTQQKPQTEIINEEYIRKEL